MRTTSMPSALLALLALFCATTWAKAEDIARTDSVRPTSADTVAAVNAPDTVRTARRYFGHKVVDYFRNANKAKDDKKVDFGFIPGPNYSRTAGVGLGLMATLTYTPDLADKSLPRSNASAFGNFTTGGYFLVGIRGNHIARGSRFRFDYKVNLSTFTTRTWGLGYAEADNDDNETDYRRNRITALARFLWRVAPNTYVGPLVSARVTQARGIEDGNTAPWHGQPLTVRAYSAGVSLTYDSRDFLLNAHRGVFLQVDQTFSPRCLGAGNYNFSSTELTFSAYKEAWRGAVIAGELHALFNYGHVPWAFMAEVGSNDRMRGYYEGRYRDRNLIEGQVELRQHLFKRHGLALWVALANPFEDFDHIAMRHTLPNAGIGYRWEFKKRINVRVDYGFTRKGGGFIFNINEAF